MLLLFYYTTYCIRLLPIYIYIYLAGGFNPSEKYEFVSWDDDIPNICKVIKFHGSKAPTRYIHDIYIQCEALQLKLAYKPQKL